MSQLQGLTDQGNWKKILLIAAMMLKFPMSMDMIIKPSKVPKGWKISAS